MVSEEFSQYAQGRGWHCVGSSAYGVYGGYPFSAVFKVGGGGIITVSFTTAQALNGKLLRALRKQLPKGCTMGAAQQAASVTVMCTPKGGSLLESMEQALTLVSQALREAGIPVSDTCPVCKGGGCDSLALVGGYVPVHRACIESQAQGAIAKAQENDVNGNYFTGLLGALLGGLVGVIPNVLAAVALERIFAILYALIPLFSYYGYKLCKGRMNKGAFVCALVSSLINLFVVVFVTEYVLLAMELEFMPNVLDVLILFIYLIAEGEMTAELAQCALFMALGLWVSWSTITKTSKHQIRSASAVQSTLQPYDRGGAGAGTWQGSGSSAGSYSGPELDEH